jgi:hypothetical protein
MGREAAVVAGHPLAAAAGMDVLLRGGNAVDAAITMAAVLAVVRPHMNGVGGDAFLLMHEGRSGRVRALNGSGRSPAAATPAAAARARLHEPCPTPGVHSVTVPGAVRAWAEALRRHGTIPLDVALAPAIQLCGARLRRIREAGCRHRPRPRRIATIPSSPRCSSPMVSRPHRVPCSTSGPGSHAPADRTRGPDALYIGDIGLRISAFMQSSRRSPHDRGPRRSFDAVAGADRDDVLRPSRARVSAQLAGPCAAHADEHGRAVRPARWATTARSTCTRWWRSRSSPSPNGTATSLIRRSARFPLDRLISKEHARAARSPQRGRIP